MTLPDIQQGHLLRAERSIPAGPQGRRYPRNYDDSESERLPMHAFGNSRALDLPPEDRWSRYNGWVAYSVDWKEHPCCPAPGEILERHNRGNVSPPYDTVWQLPSAEAVRSFEVNGSRYHFSVEHWPENDDPAHAHLLLPPVFAGDRRSGRRMRRHARAHLARCAEEVFPAAAARPLSESTPPAAPS